MAGDEVLLEDELREVGDGLEEAEGAGVIPEPARPEALARSEPDGPDAWAMTDGIAVFPASRTAEVVADSVERPGSTAIGLAFGLATIPTPGIGMGTAVEATFSVSVE